MADAPHTVWALKQRGLSATERLVLIYLANRANGAMVCWPAIDLIATDLELSTRAVMRAVQALEDRKLITVERRHRQANHYHIERPNGSDPDPQTAEPEQVRVTVSHSSATFRVPESHSRVTVSHSSPDLLGDCESLKEPILGDCESHHPSKKESSKKGKNTPTPHGVRGVCEPAGFAMFWREYPRKVGKRAAATAYAAAIKRGATPEAILDGLEHAQWNPEPRYQPHPTTWLNRDGWLDEHDTVDPVVRALERAFGTTDDLEPAKPFTGRLLQ